MTHWKFLNVKGFVWKTVLGDLNCSHTHPSYFLWPQDQWDVSLNIFSRKCCFCLEKVDHMTNGCFRCIQNFTHFQTQQLISTECYFYTMTILTIKDKIIEVTFNNSWTTCTFNNGFLYHKAVTEQIRIKTVLSIATCLQTRLQLQELLQSG